MNSVYRNKDVSLTRDLQGDLRELTLSYPDDKIFLIYEANTWKHCHSYVIGFREIPEDHILILNPGEEQKRIEQVMNVWDALGSMGIDRHSLILNIGGGMLTDLGGFAASTLKRGISFINIPTTLLAMVDASVGGKTGVNFRGLKNEVGVIRQPMHVLILLQFLRTLDRENLLSGFAEMLKAGLIADGDLWDQLKDFDLSRYDDADFSKLIWRSVEIKKAIVETDPEEKGARQALNFGHTIGHALESEALQSGHPVPHGFAVAWGMITEAMLSQKKLGLSSESVRVIRDAVERLYGHSPAKLTDPDRLLSWMKFDKKNTGNRINFTLLEKIGKCRINCTATEEEIINVMRDA
ncbi:MAG: 3-dehydroquinate synthase [Bacteroidota bacterium]